jgi:D-glycero-alpha-D-manno-heptose 1-phosphate guanylyltransferase
MHKDCIILAGGLGTRIKAVLQDTPKCLAAIDGQPFLHYIMMHLKKYHFCKIIFSVGHLSEPVKNWVLENRKTYGFAIDFAEETTPLGTGGAIKNAMQYAQSDDVVVMNGDTLFDIDIEALFNAQNKYKADVTIALKPMQNFDRYGTVIIDAENKIVDFKEKQQQASGLINGGIYTIYKPSFMSISLPEVFSFETDYLQKHDQFNHNIYGQVFDNYFIDIGIPTDYAKAQVELPKLFANG